ncbi:MAG: hypothetical protein NT030_05335 [Candidatus Saganbacteria bacterium]|nr:hypothetical protein [Candidatus Saganbacteria bacterium]
MAGIMFFKTALNIAGDPDVISAIFIALQYIQKVRFIIHDED